MTPSNVSVRFHSKQVSLKKGLLKIIHHFYSPVAVLPALSSKEFTWSLHESLFQSSPPADLEECRNNFQKWRNKKYYYNFCGLYTVANSSVAVILKLIEVFINIIY